MTIDRARFDPAYHGVARPVVAPRAEIDRHHPDPGYHGVARPIAPPCCHHGTHRSRHRHRVRFPGLVEVRRGGLHGLYCELDGLDGWPGIFVATCAPAAVGETVELRFSLGDMTQPCDIDGEVEWVRPHDPGRIESTPGMGVRPDWICPATRDSLWLHAASEEIILAERSRRPPRTP